MRAIPQLVSAPLKTIPIPEHFRRSLNLLLLLLLLLLKITVRNMSKVKLIPSSISSSSVVV